MEGSGHDLTWHLPGGSEESHKKPSIMIASFWVKIQTQNLPNIKQEAYHKIVTLCFTLHAKQ